MKFNKHYCVLITKIIMTSSLVDCQSNEILYNISLGNNHLNLYAQCRLFPSYVCTIDKRKGRASVSFFYFCLYHY